MTSDVVITKDPELGLWECRLTIDLPTILLLDTRKTNLTFVMRWHVPLRTWLNKSLRD